jgi:hypothetical protein
MAQLRVRDFTRHRSETDPRGDRCGRGGLGGHGRVAGMGQKGGDRAQLEECRSSMIPTVAITYISGVVRGISVGKATLRLLPDAQMNLDMGSASVHFGGKPGLRLAGKPGLRFR